MEEIADVIVFSHVWYLFNYFSFLAFDFEKCHKRLDSNNLLAAT